MIGFAGRVSHCIHWQVLSSCLLPLAFLLVSPTLASAQIRTVNAGDDLQATFNAAQPGDEIVLAAGARFTGTFRLPVKPFGAVITIRSSATLPARRITPADAALLPIIGSGTVESALTVEGTSNWRLDGLAFASSTTGEGNIIDLQDATSITMDRLLIVAGPEGQKRAIKGNGRHITLTRSHIANIWRAGQDSQAFCAWDGAGPYTVTDNYLEAASENVMFGGANSLAADRVPADILVERNHFTKRLEWRGQGKAVKNLFELKSAKRVTIRDNVFERNWTDAQSGTAIVFTVRNDEGGAPWSVIEDVLFERNIVRDTEGVFNVLGYDGYQPSGRTTRVTIRHNLAIGTGFFLLAGAEVGTLIVDHNTVDQGRNFLTLYRGDVWAAGTSGPRPGQFAVENLTITNTLANHNDYGAFGENAGIGTPALVALTRTYQWTHNVLAGGAGQTYPSVTWLPTVTAHRAQFNPDYTLVAASTYRGAGTDHQDLGASMSNPSTMFPRPPSGLRIVTPGASNQQAIESPTRVNANSLQPSPTPPHFILSRVNPRVR
jgi:hypothetical protein